MVAVVFTLRRVLVMIDISSIRIMTPVLVFRVLMRLV
jgi:hypothetical protein